MGSSVQQSSSSCAISERGRMLSLLGTSPLALRPNLFCPPHSQSCFPLSPGPLCLGQSRSILKSWTSVSVWSFRTVMCHWSGQSCMALTLPWGLQVLTTTLTHRVREFSAFLQPRSWQNLSIDFRIFRTRNSGSGSPKAILPACPGNSQTYFNYDFLTHVSA